MKIFSLFLNLHVFNYQAFLFFLVADKMRIICRWLHNGGNCSCCEFQRSTMNRVSHVHAETLLRRIVYYERNLLLN